MRSNQLPIGKLLSCERNGLTIETLRLISCGKHSSIYIVNLRNKYYALKWFEVNGNEIYKSFLNEVFNRIIATESPHEAFLWPLLLCIGLNDLQSSSECSFDGIGYLMPLKQKTYIDSIQFIKSVNSINLKSLIKACSNISKSIACLHEKKMYHRDLSLNNILIDSLSGNIQICDNEFIGLGKSTNLSGLESRIQQALKGTPGFIAPEILNNSCHSQNTDNYSLAIIIYSLLTRSHINTFSSSIHWDKIDSLRISEHQKSAIKKLLSSAITKHSDSAPLRPTADEWYKILSEK